MLYDAIKCLAVQAVVCCMILLICATVIVVTTGSNEAVAFLSFTIRRMHGPWVWGFGFGLAMFIGLHGRSIGSNLINVLEPDEHLHESLRIINAATSHRAGLPVSVSVVVLGIVLTTAYNPPHRGLSYIMAFSGITSIYYIAGFLLFNFVSLTRAFHRLYQKAGLVQFRQVVNPLHIEALTAYLSLTTLMGVAGIYAGFRGTVTAEFQFVHPVWKGFLITPLVLFLPATLFYNWYPRHVLQRILYFRVFQLLNMLSRNTSGEDTRSVILDIKGAASSYSYLLPFLDIKTLPAYLVTIHFFFMLAYSRDPAVRSFID